jgi:hypothetical protein
MVFYPGVTITEQERLALLGWVELNKGSPCFRDANMGGKRVTTRYTPASEFSFPFEAYSIRNRIKDALGFCTEPTPEFKDGMVASYASHGDTCYEHVDPRWHDGLYTVHCNVILSAPEEGGDLYVEGRKWQMPEGQLICYPVSEIIHGTSLVKGVKPRLMWVFGFCVAPQQYMNTLRKYQ